MNSDIISIKGTRTGLVICLDSDYDFEEIKNTLLSKIKSSKGFFKGAKFTFHLGGINGLSTNKTEELEAVCLQNGLVLDREIQWPAPLPPVVKNSAAIMPDSPDEICVDDNIRPLMREASPALPSNGLTKADEKPSLMIYRGLRSGQKIKFDGNVIIMGDVNPGSDIIASGDIVVMGSLRGVVHAGASGDPTSVIMAYRLNPVQLRIGSVISRPPENSQAGLHPEIARLQEGQMFIESYSTHGLKI